MLLVALFHIALIELQIHLSVEQVPGSSLAAANHVHKHEVAIQDDQDQEILLKPSSYIIGANRTTLVICRATPRAGNQNINDDSVNGLDLHIKCKGLRHSKVHHSMNLSTINDETPPVSTARLIVTSHAIKKYKQQITCYCMDVSIKEKSAGLVVSMKPGGHQSISTNSTHFKPKRNRIRTVALGSSLKISWRFPNSIVAHCFHDGRPVRVDQVVHGQGKISVVINGALRKNAGFYYCKSKYGVFSPWIKLQLKGGWSKWTPWLACSTYCGLGKKIETRRCLETRFRLKRCQGPSVRALPCFGHSCQGILPQFTDEPADQVIRNKSSTSVTCAGQELGSRSFTLQMACSSNGWKISYSVIQNNTRNFPNHTVARITYNVELDRDRSGVAVIYCHCYAMARQMTKRSRIAKISFPSDDRRCSKCARPNDHPYDTASVTSTTKWQVKAAGPEPTSEHSSSNMSIKMPVIISVVVALFVVFILLAVQCTYLNRFRRKSEVDRSPLSILHVKTGPRHLVHVTDSCETERMRHFEPAPTKVVTLHESVSSGDEDALGNRASNSPLLNCFIEDPSEPVEPFPSHPSEHVAEEADYVDASVFQRGESWKSNKSTFSSVSAALCPKPKMPDTVDPDLCAWGRFTEKGGRLTIEETGVSLYIPPNALPEQTSQDIYIGLMNSKGNYPNLSNHQALLTPVVVCGPDGLAFEKPVFLTVPHNAVLDKNNCWKTKVQSCGTVEDEEEDKNKWKVLELPGGDAPLSHVSDKDMQIMIDHFTNFAVVGEANSSQEADAQLKFWVFAYYTEPDLKADEDCVTRVYCIPATEAAFKVLEGTENRLNGKISDSQKLLQISNNNKSLQITSKMIHVGWSAVTGDQKSIPFNVIWQCTEQHSPNVSFIFQRGSPQVFKFRSTFDARQEESDEGVEVRVSFCIKDDRRASSGYESEANGCQVDFKYKIPVKIRHHLCLLLDPEDPSCNDWRLFAEKLELSKVYTNYLKRSDKIKSPTDDVIEMWEMRMCEKIPLSRIEEIFLEMGRHDVVKVLQQITDVKSTNDDASC